MNGIEQNGIEQKAVLAAADLVGRSGARRFEFGYLNAQGLAFERDGPMWWASAIFKGRRLGVEGQPSPGMACTLLVGQIIDGGQCTKCGEVSTVSGDGPCVWTFDAETSRWESGCR